MNVFDPTDARDATNARLRELGATARVLVQALDAVPGVGAVVHQVHAGPGPRPWLTVRVSTLRDEARAAIAAQLDQLAPPGTVVMIAPAEILWGTR